MAQDCLFRTGFGIDFHRLEEGRPFFLGGIKIDFEKGAVGHSDADVLLHAICDALLGAAALGDIGMHFPDTDDAYKGIDSKILLEQVVRLIGEAGYAIGNIDATVCLEAPKLRPYVDEMRKVIADLGDIDAGSVSIKATTTEQMGFVGRGEGIIAYATVLIFRRTSH